MRFLSFLLLSFIIPNLCAANSEVLRPIAKPNTTIEETAHPLMKRVWRPVERPKKLNTTAARQNNKSFADKNGRICKDRGIRGTYIGRVPGKIKGCGLEHAVRVTSIDGVRLSQSATIDCTTARALKEWMSKGVKKAVGRKGGGVAEIRVVAHYACRTRNNKKGAKISEHGRGRAIDIAGFTLHNGKSFSVLRDWRNSSWSDELRRMHKAACGPFGTVLGPNADRYHQDHFHFDTARYRSGSYCK
jgi:hypothetical protein